MSDIKASSCGIYYIIADIPYMANCGIYGPCTVVLYGLSAFNRIMKCINNPVHDTCVSALGFVLDLKFYYKFLSNFFVTLV